MKTTLHNIYDGLAHLLFPELCEGCNKPLITGEQVLCLHCYQQLPRTNYHHIAENMSAMRLYGRVPYAHITSFAYFTGDGLLQHLLHELKYKDKKNIGYYLGRELGQELQQTSWAQTADVIIPVPLHPAKLAQRGYNQSMLIAEGLGEVLQVPVMENGLRRTHNTESQTRKTRGERLINVADAFVAPQDISGKHVLLVDDVLTSGATLEAAALALQQWKTVQVSIATIGVAQ